MPNGKGQLDCSYCIHWQGEYEGSDAVCDKGHCGLFDSELSKSKLHRICSEFEANEHFDFYAGMHSVEERFKWFEIELEKGVLYGFGYNTPNDLKKLKVLAEES